MIFTTSKYVQKNLKMMKISCYILCKQVLNALGPSIMIIKESWLYICKNYFICAHYRLTLIKNKEIKYVYNFLFIVDTIKNS